MWTLPSWIVEELPATHEAWGLWPNTQWLEHLLKSEFEDMVYISFDYQTAKYGKHPLLELREACFQVLHHDDLTLVAKAAGDQSVRSGWEVDAVILSAIAAIMTRKTMCVHGVRASLEDIWQKIESRKQSNPHLTDMILHAKAFISFGNAHDNHPHLRDLQKEVPRRETFSKEVIEELEFRFESSQKLALFCDKMGELYPTASLLSRNHGSWRGGDWLPPEPVCFCVFVGAAFAHLLALSADEGSPSLLTFEPLLSGAYSTMNGSFEPV